MVTQKAQSEDGEEASGDDRPAERGGENCGAPELRGPERGGAELDHPHHARPDHARPHHARPDHDRPDHDCTGRCSSCTLPESDPGNCRIILETAPAMLWLGDDQGRCVFLNRALRDFWGVTDITSFSWADTLHPDDAAMLFQTFGHAMQARQPFDVEARYRHADGRWRVLRTQARPRFDGEAFVGMVGVNFDVTEQRDTETELRRSKEQQEFALQAAGAVGTWIWDVANDIVHADRSTWQGEFGGETGQMVTGPLADFTKMIHPDDRAHVLERVEQALLTGEPYRCEYRIVVDGVERWLAAQGRCEHDAQGKPTRFAGVTVDITDRRRREDATEMLSRELSHRIKNIFTVVQMMTALAIREEPDAADALGRLSRRFQALGAAQMLSLPGPAVRQSRVGLKALAMLIFAPYSARQLALTLDGPDLQLDPEDANALALMLHELGTNAMKYGSLSRGGSVSIDVQDMPDAQRITWTEIGGPAVVPPEKAGFGSRLIRSSAASLGGAVTWSWHRDGLVWEICLPAGRLKVIR